jgi:hypothetical protein
MSMLTSSSSKSAVTTSILAPAGPQRSRVLATLNRDERVSSSLPAHLPTMLRKMLLEYIVRAEEVKEFEAGLEEHQRAKVEGGGTVLERAVREHNVGACGKVGDKGGKGVSKGRNAFPRDVESRDRLADAASTLRFTTISRLRRWGRCSTSMRREPRTPRDGESWLQGGHVGSLLGPCWVLVGLS